METHQAAPLGFPYPSAKIAGSSYKHQRETQRAIDEPAQNLESAHPCIRLYRCLQLIPLRFNRDDILPSFRTINPQPRNICENRSSMPAQETTAAAQTIAVAMSGGVDSSTVAAILARLGAPSSSASPCSFGTSAASPASRHSRRSSGRCCSLDDVYDARRVAEHLGIPYYVVNQEERFEQDVVRPFVSEYLAGRTPIPCSLCNNHLKFDQLLKTARQSAPTPSPPATTPSTSTTPHAALDPQAPRRSRQGPDVFSLRPHAGAARAHPLSRSAT